MTQNDYASLRKARPDLGLPCYQLLNRPARKRLRRIESREYLITRICAFLLKGDERYDVLIQRRRLLRYRNL